MLYANKVYTYRNIFTKSVLGRSTKDEYEDAA